MHAHSSEVYFHSFTWCSKVTGCHAFKLTGFLHPYCVEDKSIWRKGEVRVKWRAKGLKGDGKIEKEKGRRVGGM